MWMHSDIKDFKEIFPNWKCFICVNIKSDIFLKKKKKNGLLDTFYLKNVYLILMMMI